MPRPRTTNTPLPGPASLVDDEPNERTIEAYEALLEILANVGDTESVLRINRRAKDGTLEFCEQIPATPDFSEDVIKREWGGGTYMVQLWGPNPDKPGSRKYFRQISFKIAGAPKEKVDQAAPTTGTPDGSYTSLLLEVATLKGLVAGMQQGRGEQSNPLDNLEKLTTIVKNMMPPPPVSTGASEAFALARDVIGFGKELAGDGDGGGASPWGALIEKGISPMIELIKQNMEQTKQLSAGGATVVPAPAPELAAPAAPVLIPEPGTPMWQAEIVKVMPRLIARAKAGKSPELIAGLFIEDAPGAVVQELEPLVADPQFIPTALALAEKYFPDVVPVRAWFEQFLLALKEELTEQEEPEEPRSGASVNSDG